MKRLFLLLLLIVTGASVSFAQGKKAKKSDFNSFETGYVKPLSERKPVTSKWSIISGDAEVANHYFSNHEYTGEVIGIEAKHGRFYRKSERLSWQLTLTHLRRMHRELFGGGLHNPAETSHISLQSYEADYAVFYNWLLFDRLQLRAGGSLNMNGGFMYSAVDAMNNVISIDFQTQLLAAAQARYGWDFKKFGMDIYANISTPFVGFTSADSRFETLMDSTIGGNFSVKEDKHLLFSAPHNLQGMNFEMGIDFALRNLTLSYSIESRNRWWHAHGLQNYRKYTLTKIGISVNLFAQQKYKSSDRHF